MIILAKLRQNKAVYFFTNILISEFIAKILPEEIHAKVFGDFIILLTISSGLDENPLKRAWGPWTLFFHFV